MTHIANKVENYEKEKIEEHRIEREKLINLIKENQKVYYISFPTLKYSEFLLILSFAIGAPAANK